MGRFERVALLAVCSASVAACNLVAGLGNFHDVPCEPCAEAGDGPPDPIPREAGGEQEDGGLGTLADGNGLDAPDVSPLDAAGDADATTSLARDAGDAGDGGEPDGEAGSPISPEASVDYRWARWRMPNGAATGLPNPASYAPAPGIDGGVYDTVTRLTWGVAQSGINSIKAATDSCIYPMRVPTRI
jgi:hypothetical protein